VLTEKTTIVLDGIKSVYDIETIDFRRTDEKVGDSYLKYLEMDEDAQEAIEQELSLHTRGGLKKWKYADDYPRTNITPGTTELIKNLNWREEDRGAVEEATRESRPQKMTKSQLESHREKVKILKELRGNTAKKKVTSEKPEQEAPNSNPLLEGL